MYASTCRPAAMSAAVHGAPPSSAAPDVTRVTVCRASCRRPARQNGTAREAAGASSRPEKQPRPVQMELQTKVC